MSISKQYKTVRTGLKFATEIYKNCRPHKTFDAKNVPEPHDYSDLSSWAAHPQKPNKSSFTPEGISNESQKEVDVFFVHPTSYFGQGNWNQPIGYNPAQELVDEIIMPGQTSVFNGACNIYAPYYRQATFYSFLAVRKTSARQAFQVAYQDVLDAFDYYIKNENNGRPFILASHSQGTLQLMRLLEERIESNPELYSRFIAAYAIGFQFPRAKFGSTFKNLSICTGPLDSGCVIAYDSYSYRGGPNHRLDRIEIWEGQNWSKRANKQVVGVNPLSWSNSMGKVEATANLGGVHTTFQGKGYSVNEWFGDQKIGLIATGLSAPIPGVVSAEVKEDGFLYINTPKPRIFNVSILPGYNYHNYDYALFYMNLRTNVIDRVNAYMQKG